MFGFHIFPELFGLHNALCLGTTYGLYKQTLGSLEKMPGLSDSHTEIDVYTDTQCFSQLVMEKHKKHEQILFIMLFMHFFLNQRDV